MTPGGRDASGGANRWIGRSVGAPIRVPTRDRPGRTHPPVSPTHAVEELGDLVAPVGTVVAVGVGAIPPVPALVLPVRGGAAVALEDPGDGLLRDDPLGVVAHDDVLAAGGGDEGLE